VGERGSRERHAEHTNGDRQYAGVLVAPWVLAEHVLAEEHEHEQACGERGLHHHERRQQERHELKREAEDRQPRAEQPAPAPD
jgi:hypothetical protein